MIMGLNEILELIKITLCIAIVIKLWERKSDER